MNLKLNRGAFMINLSCSDCGWIIACENCSKEFVAIDRKLDKVDYD